MNTIIVIAIAAVAAIATWAITWFLLNNRNAKLLGAKDSLLSEKDNQIHQKEMLLQAKESDLQASRAMREQAEKVAQERLEEARSNFDKAIAEIKAGQEKVLEAAKNELALENEKILKAREEAMKKEAEESMKRITGNLGKDIQEMKTSFDNLGKTHIEQSTAIKAKMEETVRSLGEKTEAIGSQAEDLAKALKGQNKMQGNWGETILENILKQEGFVLGRDYDNEFVLRDGKGRVIKNEDSGKGMRPDFALHFPDDTDIIVDSKVSLTALADYFATEDEQARKEASKRNLDSVLKHIDELASKEYQKYIVGRNTLDYTIMFIPNYGAYQLAKQEDPDIFQKAFKKNVLITIEETLLPFLRLIRSAWVQKQQFENMESIVNAATNIVKRVGLFCKENAKAESQFRTAMKTFEENSKRLVSGQQSIVKAAYDIVGCGVHQDSGNPLPLLEPGEFDMVENG